MRARDLIGETSAARPNWWSSRSSGLDPEFFVLRSGVAGAFVQKLVQYRLRLAIVGDITARIEASDALRD